MVELFDLNKAFDELFPPKEAASSPKNTAETLSPNTLESILPRLPPEGQAWLNGLNYAVDQGGGKRRPPRSSGKQ